MPECYALDYEVLPENYEGMYLCSDDSINAASPGQQSSN